MINIQSRSTSKLSKNQLFPLVFGTLLCIQFQPGLLGQNFGSGLIVFSLMLIAYLFVRGRVANIPYGFLATLICYPLYALCISISSEAGEVGVKGFVLSVTFSFLLIAMISSYGIERMKRAFVWTMLCVAAALLMTTALRYSAVVAQAADVSIPIKHYEMNALGFFPFALYWPNVEGMVVIDLVNIPRAIGIFREPGIFQAFLSTAMLLVHGVVGRRYVVVALLILALSLILTASTAGYVSLFVVAAVLPFTYHVSTKKKILLAILATAFAGAVFAKYFYDVDGGLQNKLKTVSGRERIDAFNELEEQIATSRFLGLRSQRISDLVVTQTGSLPSFILWEGVAGFLLTLLPLGWILFRAKSFIGLAPILPVLITALTSQPLWSTGPFLTVMAFAINHKYFPDKMNAARGS